MNVFKKEDMGNTMRIQKISKDDLFGRFYVRKPNGARWDSYYTTMDALRPILDDEKFGGVVKGFYLNICGNLDSVRISYFVDRVNIEKVVSVFRQFFRDHGILEIQEAEYSREIVLAEKYGGEQFEERFRNFLVLETRIGLELIEGNLLQARILLATYRWQVRKASLPFREHFEPTLKRYSPTYNSLSDSEKDQFLYDLKEWPNPPQVDWAHLMVNFVLGGDWINVFSDPNYLTPGRPMSIAEINRILESCGLDLRIPDEWKP